MKKTKKLIIMTAALALLIGVYFIWQAVGGQGGAGDETTAPNTNYTVGAVDHKTLTAVSVTRRVEESDDNGETATRTVAFDFTLKEDGAGWLWSENNSVPLNNEKFAAMATAVSGVGSQYKLQINDASELAKYGLDEPEISLSFTDGSGTHRFYVGSLNSFSGNYYFCTEDKSAVYTVDPTLPEAFRFDIYELIKTDEAPKLTDTTINSLEYSMGSSKILLTHYPSGKDSDYTGGYSWYASVNGGAEFAVAASICGDLTKALTSLDFGKCVAYDSSRDAEFGLDAGNTLTLNYQKTSTVTDSASGIDKTVTTPATLKLLIGKDKDGTIYVRPEGSALTSRLSSQKEFAAVLTDESRSLLPVELILPDYTRIDGMTFAGGGKTLAVKVVHGENDSVSYSLADGAAVDDKKLQAILTALTEAKTSAFTSDLERDPSVGGDTVFSLSLTFNKGDAASGELTVTRYSENYNLVSFMGSSERLITVDDTKALTQALAAYFE